MCLLADVLGFSVAQCHSGEWIHSAGGGGGARWVRDGLGHVRLEVSRRSEM